VDSDRDNSNDNILDVGDICNNPNSSNDDAGGSGNYVDAAIGMMQEMWWYNSNG
jgi:hypothetical protein